MPLYSDENSVSYGNPELLSIDANLALRKARLLQAAKDAAAQTGAYAPPEQPGLAAGGFTSAVTGAAIPGIQQKLGWGAALKPVLQGLGDAVQQHGYEQDLSGFNRMQDRAAEEHMARRPSDDAPENEKLAWAQAGTKIPKLAPVMQDYFKDEIIQGPVRKEARAERQATREQTIAEAKRKQQEELQYRRERDQQAEQLRRDLADQSNSLRASLHAAVAAAGGGSGDKASDYQIIQGDNGEVYRVGKKPGSAVERVDSATGKSSSQQQKDALETRGQIERSTSAINNAGTVEKLLGNVSSTGLGSDVRAAAGYFGYSDAATKAEKQLKPYADVYLKSVPRFEGPQSDKDVQTYKDAAADLANPRIAPPDRVAALQTVLRLHKQALAQAAARGNQPASPRVPPTSNAAPAKAPTSSVSDDDLVRMYAR